MVKHTQQFVGKLPTNCLSVFGHFVNLVLKGLSLTAFLLTRYFKVTFYAWKFLLDQDIFLYFQFAATLCMRINLILAISFFQFLNLNLPNLSFSIKASSFTKNRLHHSWRLKTVTFTDSVTNCIADSFTVFHSKGLKIYSVTSWS